MHLLQRLVTPFQRPVQRRSLTLIQPQILPQSARHHRPRHRPVGQRRRIRKQRQRFWTRYSRWRGRRCGRRPAPEERDRQRPRPAQRPKVGSKTMCVFQRQVSSVVCNVLIKCSASATHAAPRQTKAIRDRHSCSSGSIMSRGNGVDSHSPTFQTRSSSPPAALILARSSAGIRDSASLHGKRQSLCA